MTLYAVALLVVFQFAWLLRDGADVRALSAHALRLGAAGLIAGGLAAGQALPTLAMAADSGRTIEGLQGGFLEIYGPMNPSFFLASRTSR